MSSLGEELERLAALRSSGDLTEEEYGRLKQRLIDESGSGEPPESSSADSMSPRRRPKAVILGILGILGIIGVVMAIQLGGGSSADGLSSVEQIWVDSKVAELGDSPWAPLGQEEVSCALTTIVKNEGLDEVRSQFERDLPTRTYARHFGRAVYGCVDETALITTILFDDAETRELPPAFLECIVKLVVEADLHIDLFVEELMGDTDSETERIMTTILPGLLVCMGESMSPEEIEEIMSNW
jgi:hypothetical protein